MDFLLSVMSIMWQIFLSWINTNKLLKYSWSLLTFLIGCFRSTWLNIYGISLTCLDVDGWFVLTNCSQTYKNSFFSFWTSNDTFFCVIGRTCSCPCCAPWSAPVVTPPLVTTIMFASIGPEEIAWMFWLGLVLGVCIGWDFPQFDNTTFQSTVETIQ